MTQYFLDALEQFFTWVVTAIESLLNTLLAPLVPLIPDMSSYWDGLSGISSFLGFVNSWIALDWGVSLLVSYFLIMLVLLPIKIIVKLF